MKSFQRFTDADRKLIADNIHVMTNKQIGELLGRSKFSIGYQVTTMKIYRYHKRWTTQEVSEMRGLIKTTTRKNVAIHFGVSEASIKQAFKTYGIKSGRDCRFKKGNISPNKGKKMPPGYSTEAMKRTQFKKGQLPYNTLQDGDIRTRRYANGISYKWIRISLNVWEQLSRYNYKKDIGPIPDGFLVAFKNGDTLNCEPANLFLETLQQHMQRNSIARFPPELISTIMLFNKVKRKLKSYEKQD